MNPLLIGLLLLAALAHASWNAMLKGKRSDPLTASAGLSLVWALVGWPLTMVVDAPAPASYPFLAVSVVVHLGYFSLLVAAYRRGDLSFVYPIARGLPPVLVAAVSAVFLHETLTPLSTAGVALIALGVLTVGWPTRNADAPRPLGLALGTAAFITVYTLLDGWGVRAAGGAVPFLVWLTAVQGSLFFLGALALRRAALLKALKSRPGPPLAAGLLSAGGYGVALYAMAASPIALVSALRETSVLFAAVLGAVLLKEPFGRRRLLAAAVIAAGVVCVRVA
ncbi:MAG: EamA family transporter [Sandaracinaceae bacterium]